MATATLKVTRTSAGIELRRGLFEICVDGTSVGTIAFDHTVETPLEPGPHTLRIRVGRYSSKEHPFDVADGDLINFHCHGAILWPRYVVSLAKPDLAISLKEE